MIELLRQLGTPLGILGLAAQAIFTSRFLIQWLYSEHKKKSTIPIAFWYLSLMGGLGLLTYAIGRRDAVIILGQMFGVVVYTRNLVLVHRERAQKRAAGEMPPSKFNRHTKRAVVVVVFMMALGAAWLLQDDLMPIPVSDWNEQQVDRIEQPEGDELCFVVLGDSRGADAVFTDILKRTGQEPDVAFAIHLGDMVNRGLMRQWHHFFGLVNRHAPVPLLAVPGNHDFLANNDQYYRSIFGPTYYAFDVGPHTFITLNTAYRVGGPDDRHWKKQLAWLERELAIAQDQQTRIILAHAPLRSFKNHPVEQYVPPEVADRLVELFQKYHVSHVFLAHYHGYYEGQYGSVPFTVTGGAGAPFYGDGPEHDFHHYLRVDLDGSSLNVTVRRLDGE